MSLESRKYHIVILGATGFTGKICCEYIAGRYGGTNASFQWALAGRSKTKLIAIRDACTKLDGTCMSLDVLECDSLKRETLDPITASTQVVLSTVGPYAKYGNALVDSCVANGTHYTDITGETQWIREVIDRVHRNAITNKVKIVHCCGYDSIPSDLGALMMVDAMKQVFGKNVEEVRTLIGPSKGAASGGTLASMVNIIDNVNSKQAKKLSEPYFLGGHGSDGPDQRWVRFEPRLKVWTCPFIMAAVNSKIVRRTASLISSFYLHKYSESTITGSGLKGWIKAVLGCIFMPFLMILFYFRVTRWLLWRMLKLPRPGEGPSKEFRESAYFVHHLVAESAGKAKQDVLYGVVAGSKDPGYGQTAIMVVESAICLALDQKDHPNEEGGVLTPASAMGQALITRLRDAGMIFSYSKEAPNLRTTLGDIFPDKLTKRSKHD